MLPKNKFLKPRLNKGKAELKDNKMLNRYNIVLGDSIYTYFGKTNHQSNRSCN